MNPFVIFAIGFAVGLVPSMIYAAIRCDNIAQANYDREQAEYTRGYQRGLHESERRKRV